MVQLGNFHIGSSVTAEKPMLTVGEAHLLWDYVSSRYDIIELTQLLQNFIHDIEFKSLVAMGLQQTLEKQVKEIEKLMDTFMVPLPNRPPKTVHMPTQVQVADDNFIFTRIFNGVESFLEANVRTVRSIVSNDPMRKMFIKFVEEEVVVFDNLIKYGKVKGWIVIPPSYQP
jgi:hypothetical protein